MTKVVHIKRFPFMGGFYAIDLFGIIFTVQELNAVELNHERIHTAQQRELLYIGFYLWICSNGSSCSPNTAMASRHTSTSALRRRPTTIRTTWTT